MVSALSLEEAQMRLLALAEPLTVERNDVPGAIGRFLAEPLIARRTQPSGDQSIMDGYAVRADDLSGSWHIIGESAAGRPFAGELREGEAVRISTGALLPEGAGCVILQEDVTRRGDRLLLCGDLPSPAARYIRRKGQDFAAGSLLLPQGVRIGPAQMALALAGGNRHLPVRRVPVVAIIDSGDELCPADDTCGPSQIPASNGLMLAALAGSLPCQIRRLGPVPDQREALLKALRQAEDADVVVSSGGVSVGDHDLVRPALEAWGARIEFWRVAIKPGKPLLVATRDSGRSRQLILGLPGNPASAYVTAVLFLLPLLRALLGASEPLPLRFRTVLGAPVGSGGARREFLRAVWDGSKIVPLPLQDSGALAMLAASNALIDRPQGAGAAALGDEVSAYLLGFA